MIESAMSMVRKAAAEGYAIGYFESWSIESLQGVVDAAEQTRSPIAIGFSGDFLFRKDRIARERVSWYGALCRAAAESASVPCSTIFNECPDDAATMEAIQTGFGIVMPVAGEDRRERYLERVKTVAEHAHRRGAAVEIELDELPCDMPDADDESPVTYTPPAQLADFVKRSGADLLAVSVGNVHMSRGDAPGLDFDRLRAVGEQVGIPLVLHGGTGISAEDLTRAIGSGVAWASGQWPRRAP